MKKLIILSILLMAGAAWGHDVDNFCHYHQLHIIFTGETIVEIPCSEKDKRPHYYTPKAPECENPTIYLGETLRAGEYKDFVAEREACLRAKGTDCEELAFTRHHITIYKKVCE